VLINGHWGVQASPVKRRNDRAALCRDHVRIPGDGFGGDYVEPAAANNSGEDPGTSQDRIASPRRPPGH
jgi:hypothetical protein